MKTTLADAYAAQLPRSPLGKRLTALGFTYRSAGGLEHDVMRDGLVVYTGTAHRIRRWLDGVAV